MAANVAAAPISDASTTRPLRILYMYKPINSAIGTVQAIVNVPHELPGHELLGPGRQRDAMVATVLEHVARASLRPRHGRIDGD